LVEKYEMKIYPYPLGLPKGTVRATITLLFFLSAALLIFMNKDVPNSLATTILIVVSFYYGTRKGIPPATEMLKKKKAEKGETAFNMPANSVRTVIFAGFIVLTVKILISPAGTYNEIPEFILEGLVMIAGFVGGSFLSRFIKLFQDDQEEPGLLAKIVLHGKALVVIAVTIVACLLYLVTGLEIISSMDTGIVYITGWAANLLIGFYFGSRK
jgi:hypothetical protein